MGLLPADLRQLLPQMFALRDTFDGPLNLLSLGYPSIFLDNECLNWLDSKGLRIKAHPESREILELHGLSTLYSIVLDARPFFEAMGFQFSVSDIEIQHGSEFILDLNQAIPESMMSHFHVILDPGTLEHCANPFQAAANILQLLKVGGLIYHFNPMEFTNHGYFNISPVFYMDFYSSNGARILPESSFGCLPFTSHAPPFGGRDVSQPFSLPPQRGASDHILSLLPHNRVLIKKEMSLPLQAPIQGHYLNKMRQLASRIAFLPLNELEQELESGFRLGLMPAGDATRQLLPLIQAKVAEILLFDNHRVGEILQENQILEPWNSALYDLDLLLLTSPLHQEALVLQLMGLGLPPERIRILTSPTIRNAPSIIT